MQKRKKDKTKKKKNGLRARGALEAGSLQREENGTVGRDKRRRRRRRGLNPARLRALYNRRGRRR